VAIQTNQQVIISETAFVPECAAVNDTTPRTEIAPEAGRLDVMLSRLAGVSRALARVWLEGGAVRVNEKQVVKGSLMLKGGETLEWTPPPPLPSEILPEDIPLTVLYEDESLIAVDKPAGMLTHPAAHVHSGTLVNALLGRVPLALQDADFGVEGYRPGIVHRLDQDTSGVIIVAKTREAHARLSKAFADRRTKKTYLAITVGVPPLEVTVDAGIGRHPTVKTRMSVGGTNARDAKTDFTVIAVAPQEKPSHALVRSRIHTGRTHQIRVHLQHLKTPILGDDVYGKPSAIIDRQALHAWRLELQHPMTGAALRLEATPPEDFVTAWLGVGGTWAAQRWGLEA
jgi:23S rRNA pseudouridine1911/1915/1917 synthase